MEEIDDNMIYNILYNKYYEYPVQEINPSSIDLKDKKIILLCGSGCSRDDNIPTFEEMKKENYYEIFSQNSYENDTIYFYENLNQLMIKCRELKKIKYNQNVFIVTTNIDGMFIGDQVFEIHGNIFEYKCHLCSTIYERNKIDGLPLCKMSIPLCNCCNHILKPNIQLFGDVEFQYDENKYKQYESFKKECNYDNTIIFEIGCGLLVPLLRHESHLLKKKGYDVYRINVKDFDEEIKGLKMSGKTFIQDFYHT